MRNFKQYDFWIDAKNLVKDVYHLCKGFPVEERYALCDQLRRAVISIASNIAEGAGRESELDFAHFLDIALGSACEVDTQIEIAKDLGYVTNEEAEYIINKLQSIEKRLTAFIALLRKSRSKS